MHAVRGMYVATVVHGMYAMHTVRCTYTVQQLVFVKYIVNHFRRTIITDRSYGQHLVQTMSPTVMQKCTYDALISNGHQMLRGIVTNIYAMHAVQGRTSRWGIAWSFAADPATAAIPLPRYSPQQPT